MKDLIGPLVIVKEPRTRTSSRTRTMMGTMARKESRPGNPLIEARRVTHSSPLIVLELVLVLVLDLTVEFL
jgi:hypothetical protein